MSCETRQTRLAVLPALICLSLICLACPALHAQSVRERQTASRDHVNEGNYLLRQNQFEKSIDEYKKALEIDPTNAVAKGNIVTCHLNWGNYLVHHKKFSEALKQYQTCLILNPHNARALYNISIVKKTMARQQAAPDGQMPAAGQEKAALPAVKSTAQPAAQPPSAVLLTPGFKVSSPPAVSATPPADSANSESTQTESLRALPAAGKLSPETNPAEAAGNGRGSVLLNAASQRQASFEDLLSALETKIYGHKQTEMPVLKRLDKLEMDSSGQTRTGTIKDRIELLNKNYGL